MAGYGVGGMRQGQGWVVIVDGQRHGHIGAAAAACGRAWCGWHTMGPGMGRHHWATSWARRGSSGGMWQGVVWVAHDGARDGSSLSMGHIMGARTYWCVATSHALNTCEVVVDGMDGHLGCVKHL